MGMGRIAKMFVNDMATAGLNFIKDAMAYETKLCSLDAVTFAEGLKKIRLCIADLIYEVETFEVTYKGAQKEFSGILKWVGIEVKEYLYKQSTVDCMVFMDKSFQSLCHFSDAFNVSLFISLIVSTAITLHLLLMLLQVKVSHIPMEIYLSPLTSDATVVSGQMVLLRYIGQQSVAIWDKQSHLRSVSGVDRGKPDLTIKSEDGGNIPDVARCNILQEKLNLTPLRKDRQDTRLSHSTLTPVVPMGPPDSPQLPTPPPLPLTPADRKHSTPKSKKVLSGSSIAALLNKYQQSHSRNIYLTKNTPTKDTPIKNTPTKDALTLNKKNLTPNLSTEPPIKKQCTGFPSSKQESDSDNGRDSRKGNRSNQKKKKKKKNKSNPIVVSDSEVKETKEQQENCQRKMKWDRELELLYVYCESHNIFHDVLQARGSGSHVAYLEMHLQGADSSFFFIRSFQNWRDELQKTGPSSRSQWR